MNGHYSFDRYEVRPGERQLLIDGAPAALGARAFDLLVALIERRDRVVGKADLFEAVWPGLVVEENNLQVQVSSLRKLLGPNAIATVPGRGYQFVAALDAGESQLAESAPAKVHPNNLPHSRTRFIGREAALADCARMLRDTRLLTLSGIGGCGKTRLAQELAQRQLGTFPDGVWFVDLGPLQEAQRVSVTVAGALGVQASGLADHLRTRRALVVMDNCEHVVDAAVDSIGSLLATCGALKIVATSREVLGMAGEQVFAVRSLSLPETTDLDEVRRSEAVRLFVDHARLVAPDFDVDERNAAAIAEICHRLDGIALAIELAAARVRVLSIHDIRARLTDRFRLLTGGNRALPRHQTLHAMMQWSHDHLTPAERTVFRRLAVFAGGCTLDAAARVTGEGGDEYEVLERLTALHDKSLLLVDRDTQAQPRYRMLETVRQYAEERLTEAGESDEIRTRHLLHYVALAEQAAPALKGSRRAAAIAMLRPEQENLLAAFAWTSHAPEGGDLALRLIASAWRYWSDTAQPERGFRLAQSALDLGGEGPDTRDRCHALDALTVFSVIIGRYDVARACGERCLAMARRLDDKGLIADGLGSSAIGFLSVGDATRALACYSEAIEAARALNDVSRLSTALHGMAEIHRSTGDLVAAETFYRESLELSRAADSGCACVATFCGLASLLVASGQPEQARALLTEALADARALNYGGLNSFMLDIAAVVASATKHDATAARFHGAAVARLQETGSRHEPVDEAFIAPRIAAARERMGEAAFAAAEREGAAIGCDTAIAEMEAWLARPQRA